MPISCTSLKLEKRGEKSQNLSLFVLLSFASFHSIAKYLRWHSHVTGSPKATVVSEIERIYMTGVCVADAVLITVRRGIDLFNSTTW